MMALEQAAKILNASCTGSNINFSNISTDTRNLKKGDLYIALQGELFDGHDYIEEAKQAGAVALIVHKEVTTDLPLIKVEDTRKALGDLAAAKREKFPGKVAAITGSNGKTTVKEMLAAIVAKQGSVLATQGNFNNDIGLPLTLLRMQQEDYAVIEMGASHAGEIAYLTGLTKPDVVLINNAAAAHIEGFGSIKGVAHAKGEIFQGLVEEGIAVVNKDDDFSDYWLSLIENKNVIKFSMRDKTVDIYGEWQNTKSGHVLKVYLEDGELEINLKVHGQHNAMNALAAISMAKAMQIKHGFITQALNEFSAVKGRLNFINVNENLTIIDDTYNANTASLFAGIDVLTEQPGKHWLVLGDMGELGDDKQRIHFDAGLKARKSGVYRLLTIGEASQYAVEAFGDNAQNFETKEELVSFIKQHQSEELVILVKGSRFMQMEQIVESIIEGSS